MIEFCKGDLFSDDSQAWVNPVNCVGVSGKGVALKFKNRFPANHRDYADFCYAGMMQPGRIFVHKTEMDMPEYILNFPTKRHWKDSSNIDDLRAGLKALVSCVNSYHLQSVAMPAIGCGLGGLHWDDVQEAIELELTGLGDVWVKIYEPQ